MRLKLVNKIVMQYLDEPFFNDLRTQQQLGYIVFSRPDYTRNIIGNQFIVQSPKRSCEYLIHKINDFLIDIKKIIDTDKFTDEDFITQRNSVLTNLKEKDITLQREKDRFWRELTNHEYNFERQQQEIDMLQTITKEEFIGHFNKVFFSEQTKRLDLELTAEAHKEEQEAEKKVNDEHPVFKAMGKRVLVGETIVEFKKKAGLHANTWNANFIKGP